MYFAREDVIWAAGLLEGEGYFGAYPTYTRQDGSQGYKVVVECSSIDQDVLSRLHAIIPWAAREDSQKQRPDRQPIGRLRLNRSEKVYAFCVALYPFMQSRRQQSIRNIFQVFFSMNGRGHRQSDLPTTFLAGERDVLDILIGVPTGD